MASHGDATEASAEERGPRLTDLAPADKAKVGNLLRELAKAQRASQQAHKERNEFSDRLKQLRDKNNEIVQETTELRGKFRQSLQLLKTYQRSLSSRGPPAQPASGSSEAEPQDAAARIEAPAALPDQAPAAVSAAPPSAASSVQAAGPLAGRPPLMQRVRHRSSRRLLLPVAKPSTTAPRPLLPLRRRRRHRGHRLRADASPCPCKDHGSAAPAFPSGLRRV